MGWLVFNSRYFQNAGIHKVEGVQIHRKFLDAQASLARTLVRRSVGQSVTNSHFQISTLSVSLYVYHPKITGRDLFLKAITNRFQISIAMCIFRSVFFFEVSILSDCYLPTEKAKTVEIVSRSWILPLDTEYCWILDTAVIYCRCILDTGYCRWILPFPPPFPPAFPPAASCELNAPHFCIHSCRYPS